jgi:ribosome-associated toxin RatA of RatAB toxin-antitoxin module
MKSIHKSVLIWYSAQEMFELVTDVSRYPEFLPWCDRAAVLDQQDVPGREVHMHLVDGPFSRLEGVWKFIPLGAQDQRACKVELDLTYGFDSMALATLVGPVFDKIAGSLVDAFVKRAEKIYG